MEQHSRSVATAAGELANSAAVDSARDDAGRGVMRRLGLGARSGYWWRRKVAVGLISAINLPIIIWTAGPDPSTTIVLMAALLAWIVEVTSGRTLRGWSVRLPAEAVADLLRFGWLLTPAVALAQFAHGGPIVAPFALQAITLTTLIAQALFIRGESAKWVRIAGSPSSLGAAVSTFEQCLDLFGREGCRFAPFRADRPEFDAWERRVRAWLGRGETVLVLEPSLMPLARRLRRAGDVIFAEDCLLFTSMAKPAGPFTDYLLGCLNRALALLGALLLWPLAIAVAIAIRLDDGGPVFFLQERIGMNGRRFTLLKFRTMRLDAAKYAVHPNGDDPRITRVGRVLRRYSIDELPQIVNVFKGDMRLVGPRPEMPFIVEQYSDEQRRRLSVAPGITGLWQVSPHRNDPIHEHIEYDLAYIAHRGPILDVALIIATFGLASSSGN